MTLVSNGTLKVVRCLHAQPATRTPPSSTSTDQYLSPSDLSRRFSGIQYDALDSLCVPRHVTRNYSES